MPDTLDTIDFVFEIDDALNMGFKHEFAMWTVEQKRGKWIEDGHYERCSECGEPTNEYHNYCPNCGADMRGEQDE